MSLDFLFFFNSALLGVGLAMDAFSVSLANGLSEPCMKLRRMTAMAGVFALFQALMPMLGWICIHTVLQYFELFEKFIPWIALVLLAVLGSKMLYDGIKGESDGDCGEKLGAGTLLLQGIATSIDALSVGFTIAEYDVLHALTSATVIAAVTFVICMLGIYLGKKFGTRLAGKAQILGGSILIIIGIEIFVTGII